MAPHGFELVENEIIKKYKYNSEENIRMWL